MTSNQRLERLAEAIAVTDSLIAHGQESPLVEMVGRQIDLELADLESASNEEWRQFCTSLDMHEEQI